MAQEVDKGSLIALPLPDSGPAVPEGIIPPLNISPEPYRTIVELARDGICVVDADAKIIFINQFFATLLGYAPGEVIGRPLFDMVAPEAHGMLGVNLERRRQGLADLYEINLRKQDGSPLPAMVSAAPIMHNGLFLGSFAIITDISDLKRVEAELRSATEFRETIINSITDDLLVIDPRNCRIVLANDSFRARMGWDKEALGEKTCFEVMHHREGPCQEAGIFCPVQESANRRRQVLIDKNFVDSQGQVRTYQIAAYPHLDRENKVDLVICLERDVTDRRKMEETLAFRSRELQKTQMQLEKLFEISRERTAKRSVPELVQFLHDKICEAYPGSDAIFAILGSDNGLLVLDECALVVQEPLRRLRRRLEQAGLLGDFTQYLHTLAEPQAFTFADRHKLPPFLSLLSNIYQGWFALPVFAKQNCVGLFVQGYHSHQSYSREDLNFFHALFAQVGCYLRYLIRQEGEKSFTLPELVDRTGHGDIIGQSKKMQEVYQLIDLVSGTDATVLVTGENGTGKELVARTIHRQSKRSRGPFVVANCSAYSPTLLESELFGHEKGAFTGAIRRKKGRFELAQAGTLFLDEIGDIPAATQVLLLRFLQDHCFERVGGEITIESDVRVLAATNRDLYREVQGGRFRDDLYYRLNVITIHLPALRERKEDIPLLCQHFLQKYNLKEGKKIIRFSPDAMQALMDFDWPGNVRQLENAISHAVILAQGEIIRRRHLPRFLKEADDELPPTSLMETERRLILRVLKEASWNKHEAARRLRVSRSTLYSKLRRYGISPPGPE